MASGGFDRAPSILVSAVLHAAAGLAIWYFWPKTPPAPFEFGQGVAINVITSASPPPAEQADVVQQAQTEVPAPEPTPPTPEPAPVPSPAALKSFVAPSKASAPARPGPGHARPAAEDDFLNSASASLNKGGSRSNAAQGPTRRETDLQPRKGDASDLSSTELTNLAGPLFSVWGANCLVLGGNTADVTMQVILDGGGKFDRRFYDGRPQLLRKDGSIWPEDRVNGGWVGCNDEHNRLICAAAHRAEAALKKVEPYKVPPRFPGGVTISFHFDPRKFC